MMTLVLICPTIFALSWQRVIAQPEVFFLTASDLKRMKSVNLEEALKKKE
jgi:uncharacterized membrane protein